MKKFKCCFCDKTYVDKKALYHHLDNIHHEQLNGLTPAHFYFNFRNKKDHGTCVIDKKETQFNEKTERYERFCSDKCKQIYVKDFQKKMMSKYGKTSLTDSPEFQKKMLENRKISGKYTWSDGKVYTYTGTYELDFLKYLDKVMNLDSLDVFSPCPTVFNYTYEDKKRFYIPDIFISSVNLIIEIKASDNKHYRERDIEIEKAKDKVMEKLKDRFNYIKVFDKDYSDFIKYFKELVENNNTKEGVDK